MIPYPFFHDSVYEFSMSYDFPVLPASIPFICMYFCAWPDLTFLYNSLHILHVCFIGWCYYTPKYKPILGIDHYMGLISINGLAAFRNPFCIRIVRIFYIHIRFRFFLFAISSGIVSSFFLGLLDDSITVASIMTPFF